MAEATAAARRAPPPGVRWMPSGVRTLTSAPEASGRKAAKAPFWSPSDGTDDR